MKWRKKSSKEKVDELCSKWRRKFCWLPVDVGSGEMRWLCFIECKHERLYTDTVLDYLEKYAVMVFDELETYLIYRDPL